MALSENLAPPGAVTRDEMDAALHNLHVQIRADMVEIEARVDARFTIIDSKIDALATSTDAKFDSFTKNIDDRIDSKLHDQTVALLKWMIGMWVSIAILTVGVALAT